MNEEWRDSHYAFFAHRECEYFPCHDTDDPEKFNCLFCYCPLYTLGRNCGGNFRVTVGGIKSCVGCTFPHKREHYGAIVERFGEIAAALQL